MNNFQWTEWTALPKLAASRILTLTGVVLTVVSAFSVYAAGDPPQSSNNVPIPNDAPQLKLFGKDWDGGITRVCTIPMDKDITVIMSSSGDLNCVNDDAYTFTVTNAKKSVLAFYDKKCNDNDLFDDDYHKYRFTQSGVNVPNAVELSVGAQKGIGSEVVPGMLYFEGYSHNGIGGKLSCVKVYEVQN